jgi:hypothetical protein
VRSMRDGFYPLRSLNLFCWLLVLSCAAIVGAAHPLFAQNGNDRVELIFSGLPPPSSTDYVDLFRLTGRDVRIQRLGLTASETWSLQKSRLKPLLERAEKLGVTKTVVDTDWNRLLRPPGQGLT